MLFFTQILGLIGTALNLLSFQQKKQKTLILCQLYSSVIFSLHFLLLGAPMGGILNVIGILRAYVFSHKEKSWARGRRWIFIFSLAYLLSYAFTFLVLKKEPTPYNLFLEFLPIIGMLASTTGFYLSSASHVRKLTLLSAPMWLTYNLLNHSIGGVLTEIFSLLSALIGMFRLDRKQPSRT